MAEGALSSSGPRQTSCEGGDEVARFCVFCGKHPIGKNREHVIPQWLIRMTGDPKRDAFFGYDFPTMQPRHFDFTSFAFPACGSCNKKMSDLEDLVRGIVDEILNGEPLARWEFNAFLDWLDKVRIGLWLGYNQLGKDGPIKVIPNFYISHRIGAHDRMVAIYKTDQRSQGINFIGADTPAFQLIPSCFALRINQYYFVSLSKEFLVSRGLGFPYPRAWRVVNVDPTVVAVTLGPGSGIVKPTILQKSLPAGNVELYQPKVYNSLPGINQTQVNVQHHYDKPLIRQYSVDYAHEVGPIFIRQDSTSQVCDDSPWSLLFPKVHDFQILSIELGETVYEYQNYLLAQTERDLHGSGIATPATYIAARRYNDTVLELIREGRVSAEPS